MSTLVALRFSMSSIRNHAKITNSHHSMLHYVQENARLHRT